MNNQPAPPSCKRTIIRFLTTILLVLFLLITSQRSAADQITPEVLVSRHLESIGTNEARTAITSRIIAGTSTVVFRTEPKGQAGGRVVMASEGARNLLGMSFPSPVYPREQFGFNGTSFMAAFVVPGVRSSLGSFLMTHNVIFKQGLMGGTLSSAWPLLDLSNRRPGLEYAGQKKIDNRTVHELKYLSRGGSDLQVNLFFDKETFQHVRTEYLRVIPASTGSRAYINIEERETRYRMVEDFSEFKNESGLNLPHTYQIKLEVDTQNGTFSADWVFNLTRFVFNQPIDPASFNISAE